MNQRIKAKHHFILPLADLITNFYPSLELDLRAAKINKTPKEYLIPLLRNSLSLFIIFCVSAFLFAYYLDSLAKLPWFILFVFCMLVIMTLQKLMYPKYLAFGRIKRVEANLVSALRNIEIQIDSGLSLYQAIAHVAEGGYGEISEIFTEGVKKMEIGVSQADALRAMVVDNPSFYFRRAIWHISTALTAGGDISQVLKDIINNLVNDQSNQIALYGSKLRPLAMMYMLIVLIIPSIGTTFIIALISFISTGQYIGYIIFGITEILVLFFQIIFLGMIKVRRPNLLKEND